MIDFNSKNHQTKKKEKENKFAKKIEHEEISQLLTEESSDAGSGFETCKEEKTQQEEKNWESFYE